MQSKIWTIAPIGLSEKELYEFEYGGKVIHDLREIISDIIYKELIKDEQNVWIIEDNVAHADYTVEDNKIDDVTLPFYHNKNVFQIMTKKQILLTRFLEH